MRLFLIITITFFLGVIPEAKASEGDWQIRFILGDHGDINIFQELVVSSQRNKITQVSWNHDKPRERKFWQTKKVDYLQAQTLYHLVVTMVDKTNLEEQKNWNIRDGSTLTIWIGNYARSKAIRFSHEAYRSTPELRIVLKRLVELTELKSWEQLLKPLNIIEGEQDAAGNPLPAE